MMALRKPFDVQELLSGVSQYANKRPDAPARAAAPAAKAAPGKSKAKGKSTTKS
jgi:hypothetical protein